jgi:uncharacterized caspase-like protein
VTRAGLAPTSATGSGTYVAFGTAPGTVAADGSGSHSPFTGALLKFIETPGLEVRQMMSKVRGEVEAATDGRQIPWDSSSLSGDFYFDPGATSERIIQAINGQIRRSISTRCSGNRSRAVGIRRTSVLTC